MQDLSEIHLLPEDLSEVHLLPEELEEYSRLSRLIRLLRKMRMHGISEEEIHRAMMNNNTTMPPPVVDSPSTSGLKAAPIAPQPEPINQAAAVKPVKAKLEPLMNMKDDMQTRTASISPNNPFERVMAAKFASLSSDGVPSLEEAAAMAAAGLGGSYLGGGLARYGSGWQATEALGRHLHGLPDYLNNTRAARNQAMQFLSEAAKENKLKLAPMFWKTDAKVLGAAKDLERQMANKLTRSKLLPLRIAGGLGALLGAAHLIRGSGGGSPQPDPYQGGGAH